MHHCDEDEFKPRGEASIEPDPACRPTREESVGDPGFYPEGRPDPTRPCRGCGAPIPADTGRTKCPSCLEHGIEPLDEDQDDDDGPDTEIVQLVFAVVPGRSKYLAAAAGSAALGRVPAAAGGVDTCTPVYDVHGELASVFTDRWGAVSGLTKLSSAAGERLVATALGDRTPGTDDRPADVDDVPFFVGATGRSLDVEGSSVDAVLEDLRTQAIDVVPEVTTDSVDDGEDPPVWLMPAIGQRRRVDPAPRLTTVLTCHHCGSTPHAYAGECAQPVPELAEPIWQCTGCRAYTRGPPRERVEDEGDPPPGPPMAVIEARNELSVGRFTPPE